MVRENKENLNSICHCEELLATKQSNEIATPSGLAMTEQTGRSMVEMLSTLAIMGILSVAGVAGYNSAMSRYRANTLISEAQRRAVVVAGQIGFNNQEPSLTEFEPYNKTSAGEFGKVTTEGLYKQFGIEVSGVIKSVCQNILNTIGESTPIRRLSKEATPTTPITSCEDNNAFLFIYNDGMTAENDTRYCSTHADCDECGTCNQTTHLCVGACESACNEKDSCGENECVICDTKTKTCQNKCVEVEYLESDGESFLDTQYVVQPEDILIFGSNSTNGIGSIDGAISSTTKRLHGFNATAHVYVGNANYTVGSGLWNANSIWKVDLKNGILHYGSHSVKMTDNYTSLPNISFCFMARHNNMSGDTYDNFKAGSRFTFFKVTRNGSLIRDFIPVLSPESSKGEGEPCMFDRVTKKLYCNSGTGEFKTNLDD